MDGNNFLDNSPNKKEPKNNNDEQEIAWISPQSDLNAIDNVPDPVNADNSSFSKVKKKGIFGIFPKQNTSEELKKTEFADKKNLLKKYDSSLKASGKKSEGRKNFSEENLLSADSPQSGALKTNLVKEDVTTFVDWRKNIIFLLFGIIFSVLLVGGLYGRLVFSEQQAYRTSDNLDFEISELKNSINAAKESNREAEKFQQKLKLANGLLKNHVYWTNYFKFLESSILSDTYITSGISADFGSDFTFDVSAKTYANIDEQLLVFKENNMVKDAVIKSGTLNYDKEKGSSRIKYTLEIEVLPEIFFKK